MWTFFVKDPRMEGDREVVQDSIRRYAWTHSGSAPERDARVIRVRQLARGALALLQRFARDQKAPVEGSAGRLFPEL
jgi:hypothetical protein